MDRIRRELLTGIAGLGALAALPMRLRAAAAPAAGIVDVHHHVFPPEFVEVARPKTVNPAIIEQWTLNRTLEEMDRNGVRTAIASITQPGVWFGEVDEARALARQCNEYMARLVADHPGRFGFFGALALPDIDGSLRELAYALDTLKADGIGLMTSYGDKWPGDPLYDPIFQELNRRRATVYIHPTGAECCSALMPAVTPNLIEYPHDTARAITNLLFSGTLLRYRDIKFIFSHSGGTLPVLAGRISQLARPADREKMPQGLEFELRRLHYDVANAANRPAFGALTQIVPVSQVMFGSDYPYVPIGATASGLGNLGLSASDLAAIQRGNAVALFPRLRG